LLKIPLILKILKGEKVWDPWNSCNGKEIAVLNIIFFKTIYFDKQ
jgi:hypothetical protein